MHDGEHSTKQKRVDIEPNKLGTCNHDTKLQNRTVFQTLREQGCICNV